MPLPSSSLFPPTPAPLSHTWQVTPTPDTFPDYEEHLARLFHTHERHVASSRRGDASSGRRHRRIRTAEVTGQCSVCLDLFGVPVSLIDGQMVVQSITPRLKIRRIQQRSTPPLASAAVTSVSVSQQHVTQEREQQGREPSFALYHTHPFSREQLPDGMVKLYGSKDILLEHLSDARATGDHAR